MPLPFLLLPPLSQSPSALKCRIITVIPGHQRDSCGLKARPQGSDFDPTLHA
jgi:hypothetical protein